MAPMEPEASALKLRFREPSSGRIVNWPGFLGVHPCVRPSVCAVRSPRFERTAHTDGLTHGWNRSGSGLQISFLPQVITPDLIRTLRFQTTTSDIRDSQNEI